MRWTSYVVLGLAVSMLSVMFVTEAALASDAKAKEYFRDTETTSHKMWLTDTSVEISYASQRCFGHFTGHITDHGSYLTAIASEYADLAPNCVFTITPDGENAYRIEQGFGCSAFHGAACSLSGRVARAQLLM